MSESKHYTTAILAAVPATDDPVHEVVAEDAHVTLQFLGEAAELSEEQVEEITTALEMLASVVYPFEADISGTAELGPDKAQVLLVQSALLTKVRETLGMVEAVSTAVAASDQFPNWIPHLTLAYEGEMPDVSSYKTVTIGSLELWLAEKKTVFPLAQPKDAVTAAGLKVFEEHLHPRGADGRFIEKFGVIKFLTAKGWQYGKVEGIYEENGQVKLTVSPSNLSGKTHGESVVLTPKQVYRAPKTKAHLLVNQSGVTKIGGQGGSNPGGLYSMPAQVPHPDGSVELTGEQDQFYVKTPKSKAIGQNEALTNALYEHAGVPVPEVDLASDGKLYSKIVKGQQDMAQQLSNADWKDQVRRNFVVDAWLANRDVFGMTYDNILTDEHGVPWRIDNGGGLLYRAQGAKKTDFGSQVTELDAFRQGKKAAIFGPEMSKAQEIDGAERVLAISPADIDDLVKAHGLPKSLADTLKARRLYIADYYGLTLPESKAPAEAEGPTSAPLVDAPDIAENEGHNRSWFKVNLSQLGFVASTGDLLELPDGSTKLLGVGDDGQALSMVGAQAQLLGLMQTIGPEAQVYLKKQIDPQQSRPDHGSKLKGSDLTSQRWKRGDQVIDSDGVPWKVLGWNEDTGAMLVQFASKAPVLLDTHGKDKGETFTVQRWDPPAVDTAEPVQTEQQAIDQVQTAVWINPPPVKIETLTEPDDELTTYTQSESGTYVPKVVPAEIVDEFLAPLPAESTKTGQAAQAEQAIKADLNQPLPTGSGAPAPAKTSAPGGAKVMVIGDGTEAATGDSVTSKKDGKTYVFVKPKGQYAVVTDPNGEDPTKQLLKLASTMTQPGKAPAADATEVEAPKTATGEVPQLGMTALAKDGWAGTITLISPDGKFVFITDANGKRKRKSTGTVSITGGTPAVVDTPAPATAPAAPAPLKPYGPAPANVPAAKAALGDISFDLDDPADLDAGDMVVVGYADGTIGLEPYTGQPLDSLLKNTTGKVATHNTITVYQGPVSAEQFVAATAAKAGSHPKHYFVFWDSKVFLTDGKTGPNGGLILWDSENPSTYALELPKTGHVLVIADSTPANESGIVLPDFETIGSSQVLDSGWTPALPLYGDEAKTLADWGQDIGVGSEISLDGEEWLKVTAVTANGVTVQDSNEANTYLTTKASMAKWVIKAPPMKDGDAPNPAFQPGAKDPDLDELPVQSGKKKIADLASGDVVIDAHGGTTIIDSVLVDPDAPGIHKAEITAMGEQDTFPADPNQVLDHLGNITEDFVTVPLETVLDHLYPGAQFQMAGQTMQLVSYPQKLDNGNYRFAVIPEGEPGSPLLYEVGQYDLGADISSEFVVPVKLGSFSSAQDAGADLIQLNALFDAAATQKQDTPDYSAAMTDAGIPFGTAQYPIYYGAQSETFFRAAHSGMEEWDPEGGVWNKVGGSVAEKTKVWDGVPFTGTLKAPEGFQDSTIGITAGLTWALENYKPKPGETIQVVKMPQLSGKSLLISYPYGLDGPAHTILDDQAGGLHASTDPFAGDWKESGGFSDYTVIHDPFAAPTPGPQLTHQAAPQPPAVLGAHLQTAGYEPTPGEQFMVVNQGTATRVWTKQPDGTYVRIFGSGAVGNTPWDLDDIKHTFEGWDQFTFTWLPEGADAPAAVAGMPEGYAPFVPGEGQSLIKVTLGNGKQNVYLQKQPEAGWYELGPDGVVSEASDAVKSNFVVQQKLAGQGLGTGTVKYELLHPKPEGQKQADKPVPEFSNSTGTWTPEAGQKVVALTSYPGDSDPWFYVQSEPGGDWVPSPNTPDTTAQNDSAVQNGISAGQKASGSSWTLVYDGDSGQAAVDTPEKALASFHHHVPLPDTEVYQDAQGDYWAQQAPGGKFYYVNPETGTYSLGGLTEQDITDSAEDMTKVWPTEDGPAIETLTEAFSGYTPKPGDTVIKWTPASGNAVWLVLAEGETVYHPISSEGEIVQSGGIAQYQLDQLNAPGSNQTVETVWPPSAQGKGIEVGGYQTQPTDNVVQFVAQSGTTVTAVQQPDGSWAPIMGGQLEPDDGYSQSTIEWAANPDSGLELTVLQGTLKGAPPAEPEALPTTVTPYAGVNQTTVLAQTNWALEDPAAPLTEYGKTKVQGLTLQPGESAYVASGNGSYVYVRDSAGNWNYVYGDSGEQNLEFSSDEEMEQHLANTSQTLNKVKFATPQAAPVSAPTTYAGPSISGWAAQGLPDPATMGFLGGPEGAAGMQKGMWLFTQADSSLAQGNGTGLYVQLAEDVKPGQTGTVKVQAYAPVQSGDVKDIKHPSNGGTINFNLGQVKHIYGQNASGIPSPDGQQAPVAAPSAPQSAPEAPKAAPAYPGAQKPSQEDINAWGGALTKDGHIPTAGMFVTGKGPMSGKIISVSKDKTKATVLTADGSKSTRLISALKTDPSANYSAYAAPVTLKDIPGGMPLAVDTVAEALEKTAKDGKFRAILNGHPGVSQGQMVVTKTTAPSGKVFNRVHLTLTPAQRAELLATLAGTGEKGDWVKSSKMSDQVAVGDQLPMRKSSTDNPDGTPRWKVDPETKPPTHTVTKVEDDPSGSGVKVVTLKNTVTGEEITSRFHAGKSLSVYAWDPNKPKPVTAGAFSVSETAKAMGWQFVTDGGISAIKGGADKGTLYNEPGSAVTKSALGQVSHSWKTLRNVSQDGVVIEIADPKGADTHSTTGVTVISLPEGADEKALGAALSKMGIDYRPMNQDDAKVAVRGVLRTLLSLDTSDVDTPKHYTDEQLFKQAGQTMGISDLGWQDVLVGVDESTGKTSFFWSDRARAALAGKVSYNLVYRAASTGTAAQIVSTVKYGSASSILKKTTGMLDGSGSVGNGASASSDNSNHAGHGSYASASKEFKLPSTNAQAGYKGSVGIMVYHRPEAVLGRIMDYRVSASDAFGMGHGSGSDHLKYATSMGKVKDYFLGGGLPTEAVGFIAVQDSGERAKAIEQLKAEGFGVINGRPVEDIVITKQKAATLTPDDLPPVTIPANARPILDLPVSYDAPAAPAGAEGPTGGEAAA